MSLAVGDAPVDGAQSVVVKFTGIELTANSGNPVDITFSQPKTIDLLTQSGTASAVLFNQPIPAGSYGQIRLMVVADGNPSNSYIMLSDGTMTVTGAERVGNRIETRHRVQRTEQRRSGLHHRFRSASGDHVSARTGARVLSQARGTAR